MPSLERRPPSCSFTRRTFLRLLAAAGVAPASPGTPLAARQQNATPHFGYPMAQLDGIPGDGLLIRHGYACENTWYHPGWWHTGEDWYLADGESAGLPVLATAAGEVIFAGSEYPGLVVILQHDDGLYSMYGHLDYTLQVETGQTVARGEQLGTVLARTDGRAPSHLHVEIRDFFTSPEVNGAAPRYDVGCGYECPPGPGYWPIDAPEHPSAMGWRNPTHVINRRLWPNGVPEGVEVMVSAIAPETSALWSAPPGQAGTEQIAELPLTPGDRYPLRAIAAGDEAATGTSAEAYQLWYQVALASGDTGWVQAAVPSNLETGSDGRPSALRLDFLPVASTGPA